MKNIQPQRFLFVIFYIFLILSVNFFAWFVFSNADIAKITQQFFSVLNQNDAAFLNILPHWEIAKNTTDTPLNQTFYAVFHIFMGWVFVAVVLLQAEKTKKSLLVSISLLTLFLGPSILLLYFALNKSKGINLTQKSFWTLLPIASFILFFIAYGIWHFNSSATLLLAKEDFFFQSLLLDILILPLAMALRFWENSQKKQTSIFSPSSIKDIL